MRLADGVYAFPQTVSFPEREVTVHSAGVETDGGLALVDVGFEGELDTLVDALDDEEFDVRDVEYVLLTHQDGDHAGALAELIEETDATVLAPLADAPVIEGARDPRGGSSDRYPPGRVDVRVTDGAELRTDAGPLRVVGTPGHTPGHVSLYLPDRNLLLAADALTAGDAGLQGPAEEHTADMPEAIESVGRLASLDVDATLCYHGGYVTEGTNRIREIHERLRGVRG